MQRNRIQHKWWVLGAVAAICSIALSVGFRANPAPQPQRVSDLVARIEELEDDSASQQEQLDALGARLAALEALDGAARAVVFDPDVTIPRTWVEGESSDGVLRYWHHPRWELTGDEPGALDLWLDENSALFFTWDWSADLLDDLHGDEEFLRFFERDLLGSDATTQMEIVESDALEFMGEDAHYWEVRVVGVEGYVSRMLTIFYPCSDRASCNVVLVHFDPDPNADPDDAPVAPFAQEDWDFLNTFAHGVEILTFGKTTVTANANLRACPAIDCEITGRLVRGEIVELVAISADGYWYQLASGAWIASNLVFDAPPDLPIVGDDAEV